MSAATTAAPATAATTTATTSNVIDQRRHPSGYLAAAAATTTAMGVGGQLTDVSGPPVWSAGEAINANQSRRGQLTRPKDVVVAT